MKKCRECGLEKELSEFYKHKEMFDGHVNKCKECQKNRVTKHRKKNIDSIREYDRNRPNKDERNKKHLERMKNKTLEQNEAIQKSQKKWNKNNRHKKNAHLKVNRNLNNPGTCSRCFSTRMIQAHHPDYNKPLDILWLCVKCHNEEHVRLKKIERKYLSQIPF